ncbi:MAG: hypothetical protein RL069_2800, partial [Planctomycetota bacterium]
LPSLELNTYRIDGTASKLFRQFLGTKQIRYSLA